MTFSSGKTKLDGVFEIRFKPNTDKRGFFMRTYDDKIFRKYGLNKNWVQENLSFSKFKGTIRGLHFQYPPHAETKAIMAITGETFLVFVDLRKDSPTFGNWDHVILSKEKKNMIIIPRGFANGICTLSEDCTLFYKFDNYFNPQNYDAIKWNDPDLKIKWPIKNPSIISEKDKNAKGFKEFMDKTGGMIIDL